MRHFMTELLEHPDARQRDVVLGLACVQPAEPGGQVSQRIGERPAHEEQRQRNRDEDLDDGVKHQVTPAACDPALDFARVVHHSERADDFVVPVQRHRVDIDRGLVRQQELADTHVELGRSRGRGRRKRGDVRRLARCGVDCLALQVIDGNALDVVPLARLVQQTIQTAFGGARERLEVLLETRRQRVDPQ